MNYDAIRAGIKQCFPNAANSQLDWIVECIQKEAGPSRTPVEARDEFLKHVVLPAPNAQYIMQQADKLLDIVTKPGMLHAFALANAELAAMHFEGQLVAPVIEVADAQLLLELKS